MKHDLQWFIDRIGKKIYRDKGTCDCKICANVEANGLIIDDKLHAQYLYDCQNELKVKYYDK